MKKLNISIPLLIRILLIAAAVLALSGLFMTYGIGEAVSYHELLGTPVRRVRGFELFTPFMAIALQLTVSGLLLFLVARRWVYIVLLVVTILQLGFVLLIVGLEIEFEWFLGPYRAHFGWGYWQLLIASVFMLASCILSFFVKKEPEGDDRVIDNLN